MPTLRLGYITGGLLLSKLLVDTRHICISPLVRLIQQASSPFLNAYVRLPFIMVKPRPHIIQKSKSGEKLIVTTREVSSLHRVIH